MESNNPVPKRIREARLEIGISQKEVGIKIGMQPTSASSRMNHYEAGRHMPDYETLEKLAKELGKPVAYFFCDKDSLAQLVCLLDELPEKDRLQLIKHLSSEKEGIE